MGRAAGGWMLAKESWRVLRADRSLAIFPVISAMATVVCAALIWSPALILSSGPHKSQIPVYVALGVSVYVLTFIAVFFGTALAGAASMSLDGKDPTLRDGFSVAVSRLRPILMWSLIQAVVGLVLHATEGAARDSRTPIGFVASIIVGLLGAAWSVMTFFVIPILALERLGPVASVKHSWSIVKDRWGESVVGSVSIGLAVFLVVLIPELGAGLGFAVLAHAHRAAAIILACVGGLILAAGVLLAATLNSIFRVALYRYATTGHVSPMFDQKLLDGAFTAR
jgi:hypothetical protein